MLDTNETISRLQSSSVRNSLVLIVVNVLALVSVFTGKVFDIDAIKAAMDTWLPLAINAATAYWGWKAYKGRVNATREIEPLPIREEIKSIMKKE